MSNFFARPSILTLVVALMALLALLPRVAGAGGAPVNDDFPGTTISAVPYEQTVDTIDATSETDEPVSLCAYEATNTVWWSFTASETQVLIAAAEGADHPPVLTVWEESGFGGGGLVELNCDGDPGFPGFPDEPDFPGYPPRLEVSVPFEAEAGKTYYIQIGGYIEFSFPFGTSGASYPPGGELMFTLSAPVPPANDDFADAEVVSILPFSGEADLTAATLEQDEPRPACFPSSDFGVEPGSTVWYSYTAAADGEIVMDTLASATFPWMAVWTGSAGSLTEVACGFTVMAMNVTAGTTYYVQAGTVAFDDFPSLGGVLRLFMNEWERPVCAAATQAWTDPLGDVETIDAQSSAAFVADFVGMTAAVGPDSVCITLEFDDLHLGSEAEDEYIYGFIDLDLDQNTNTGSSFEEGPCLPEGRIGYEAYVSYENLGTATVAPIFLTGVVPQGASLTPLAGISYDGDSITIAMPIAPLGDGDMDIVAEAFTFETADCMPNDGVATVEAPEAAAFADVNCSGGIDESDVHDLLLYAGGIFDGLSQACTPIGDALPWTYPVSGQGLLAGDVNCDEEVDTLDALALLLHLSGLSADVSLCPAPGTPPVQ